jgi:hypothetical protein
MAAMRREQKMFGVFKPNDSVSFGGESSAQGVTEGRIRVIPLPNYN